MPEVATPNQGEREFETGSDESFKNVNATGGATHNENQRVTYANIKRTYDVYQDLDIQAARQALTEQTRLNQIASQALFVPIGHEADAHFSNVVVETVVR